MDFMVTNGQKFLFAGDSITDCGRRKDFPPYGAGYAKMLIDMTMSQFPERKIHFVNKGIGGNTVADLQQRWEDDVIFHRPDWLSIMIGINDAHRVLRKTSGWEQLVPSKYDENYNRLLSKTRETLPECRIILLEPFYMSVDRTCEWRGSVMEMLQEYRQTVRNLSRTYHTLIVKTQDIFDRQLKHRDSETFCSEPVHPNPSGHLVIANAMFNILKK